MSVPFFDQEEVVLSPSNSCIQVCKYMDQKGLAGVEATKRSGGVASKVDLMNHCTQVMKHTNEGSTLPGFETQGFCHQKTKTEVSVVRKIRT